MHEMYKSLYKMKKIAFYAKKGEEGETGALNPIFVNWQASVKGLHVWVLGVVITVIALYTYFTCTD